VEPGMRTSGWTGDGFLYSGIHSANSTRYLVICTQQNT
jgi:hypothetical protein